ncbi:efflux RND transporter permease subunit [Tateyamaria pelophila]|uniref:efflux RND transporter permease subunit n=1 Tax=Tateyamaria pelophila TaxID=328415 RepID=UPI001CBAE88A|nr:efflux RND transporter permease subunit [Tateyamaria pelophila]
MRDPGATPSEVADAILTPIEEQLQGLGGVRELSSTASQGVGTVRAELQSSANITEVKDDIEAEVSRITTFPSAAEQPRVTEVEPTELAVEFAIYGDIPRQTLKALAQKMRDDLTAKDGISQVQISGVPTDQIEIAISRETLLAYGIGFTELADRIRAANLDLSGGSIDTGRTSFQVRTLGDADSADDYADTVLFAGENGAQVRLSDIAQLSETLAEGSIRAMVARQPAVFVRVNRAGGEQVLKLTESAIAYLEDEFVAELPDTVTAEVWRNSGEQLQGRIDLLMKNGAIGAVLILIVLMLFLDLRIAAWVSVGVVVAFLGAFAPMLVFGTTINQLSLFGFILALGIVVDDAIVVGENIYSELEKGVGNARDAAERGIMRVWTPILFSVTTTILAFVPLLFIPGSSGSFIGPVAAVVIYVLFLSLVESFFVLPHHLSHVTLTAPRRWSPRRATEIARGVVDRRLKRFMDGPLRKIVRGSVAHPIFVFVASVAIAVMTAGLIAGGVVRFTFFPAIEGNFVTAELTFPEGTSEEETLLRTLQLTQAARATADGFGNADLLQATSVQIGFAGSEGGGGGSGVQTGNVARVSARLLDAGQREITAGQFTEEWRQAVGEVAGARTLSFSSSLVGVGAAIRLEVSAEDADARGAVVGRIREALATRDGVQDIRDSSAGSAQEIAITLTDAAASYGIDLQTVANEVRGAFYGVTVDQIARNQEEVDVRLRLSGAQRDSISDLTRLRIATPSGLVPLTTLANLQFQPVPVSIERIGGRTVITLTADVNSAVTTGGAETQYILNEIVPQLSTDYPDVEVSVGGEQEESQRFTSALALNFVLVIFAIYAVLSLAFQSYLRPLVVLLTVPFGMVGAVLGHAALGLDLTLLSMFGVVGLSGVLMNGALLMVDFMREVEQDGAHPLDAVEEAALQRFRAIILTTLTTFLGITPLILETSVQAQFLIPTAVAPGFGVLFASLLQMVLVPAYSSIFARLFLLDSDGRARSGATGRTHEAG